MDLMVVKKLEQKTILKLKNVEFDRSRFRRYYGNIGEIVTEEILLKKGFGVWLLTPYSPKESPLRNRKKLGKGGLIYCLSDLYRESPNKKSLKSDYVAFYSGLNKLKFHVPTWTEFYKKQIEDYESKIKELETFFGDKLEAFKRYMENLGVIGKTGIPGATLGKTREVKRQYIYTPDLVAKKMGKYILLKSRLIAQ